MDTIKRYVDVLRALARAQRKDDMGETIARVSARIAQRQREQERKLARKIAYGRRALTE